MKLVTFRSNDRERVGAVMADGRIIDLAAGDPRLAVDMITLIREQDELMPLARALGDGPARCRLDPATVTLLAPVPRPVAMRDGYAFRQHVATARRNRGMEMVPEFDLFPVTYFTNHQAVIGPGGARERGNIFPDKVNDDPMKQPDPVLRALDTPPSVPGEREDVYCT